MQHRPAVVALALAAVLAAAGCNGDDGGDPAEDGHSVALVAGGGTTDAAAEPIAAADARIAGRVTDLTKAPDGGVWGIVDGTDLLCVNDGQVWVVAPTLPDGSSPALADVAVSADGSVYVAFAEPVAGEPAVHRLGADGALVPGFGVAASEEELAAAAPVTPDGAAAADAVLGPVVDLAVGDGGDVTFVEQVVPGGLQAVNLVRQVSDGELVTLAGGAPTPGAEPTAEEVQAAAYPDEGTDAAAMPVLGVVHVAVDGDAVYLQTIRSLVAVEPDGGVTLRLGDSGSGDRLPMLSGPYARAAPATETEFRGSLDNGPTAANGEVLATAIGTALSGEDLDPWRWVLDDATDEAAEVAEGSAANAEPELAVHVTGDEAWAADVIGSASLLTAEGDVVVAGWDHERGETILVRYPADVG